MRSERTLDELDQNVSEGVRKEDGFKSIGDVRDVTTDGLIAGREFDWGLADRTGCSGVFLADGIEVIFSVSENAPGPADGSGYRDQHRQHHDWRATMTDAVDPIWTAPVSVWRLPAMWMTLALLTVGALLTGKDLLFSVEFPLAELTAFGVFAVHGLMLVLVV